MVLMVLTLKESIITKFACFSPVLPLVSFWVFLRREITPGRPKMAVQTSPDFLKFPRTPAGKTRDIRFFVNRPVIFPNAGK